MWMEDPNKRAEKREVEWQHQGIEWCPGTALNCRRNQLILLHLYQSKFGRYQQKYQQFHRTTANAGERVY